jgi:L-iditol 2-dehydrogenase
MRALLRDRSGVALCRVPVPAAPGPGEVTVRVAVAGVCRTDVRVARGELGTPPIILGHECAGRIHARGPDAGALEVGAPVAVVPYSPCGTCAGCRGGERCHDPRWLGLHRDGAFAEFVRLPVTCVRPVPEEMSMRLAAYVEPVAAALGVLGVVLGRESVVAVGGRNRIADLTARVLLAHGVGRILRFDPDHDPPPAPGSVDVAIESTGARGLESLIGALRPGGTLVLKSRASVPVALDLAPLVARGLTLRGVRHGSFAQAIEWLHGGRLQVADLLTTPRPLEDFAEVLAAESAAETAKLFLAIDPAEVG